MCSFCIGGFSDGLSRSVAGFIEESVRRKLFPVFRRDIDGMQLDTDFSVIKLELFLYRETAVSCEPGHLVAPALLPYGRSPVEPLRTNAMHSNKYARITQQI